MKKLFIVGILVLVALIIFGIVSSAKTKQEKAEIEAKLLSNAEKLGLEDVSFTYTPTTFEGYHFYYVSVNCSNFEQFSFDEMIRIQKNIDQGCSGAIIKTFVSNGDVYDVDEYLNGIKKNGKEIYDDYEHSDIHRSAAKYSTSSTTGSSTGYKTVSSSDDKFWYAVTAAQNLVKDELKSPSTAEFPVSASAYTVERTGSQYKVTGYVDAQNSFGAVLRTNWAAFFTMGDTSGAQYSVSDYYVLLDE